MDTQVKIDRIDIYSKGDESVGIFPTTWTVEQEIYVEKEDLETFRRNLQDAWECVADDARVYFTINGKSEQFPA
jgi:hypothetical protein